MRMLPMILMATATLSVGVACTKGHGATEQSASYTPLDDQASQLRADFNRKIGTVRLLFVVDPTCPGCLRGLDDMDRDLLRETVDPRLQVFVVHEPVLGVAHFAPWLRIAVGTDVPKAAELIHNPNVQHYWNPSGEFGRLLSKAVGLRNGDSQVYAWDVWLIYGPDAKWVSQGPPAPQLLMHQLGPLRGSQFPHLASRVFAERVRTLLAQLPPAADHPTLANQAHR